MTVEQVEDRVEDLAEMLGAVVDRDGEDLIVQAPAGAIWSDIGLPAIREHAAGSLREVWRAYLRAIEIMSAGWVRA